MRVSATMLVCFAFCIVIVLLQSGGCPPAAQTPGENVGEDPGPGDEDPGPGGDDAGATGLRIQALSASEDDELPGQGLPDQEAPDDVDVNLTPSAYTVAFMRLVLKEVDDATETVVTETEIFNAASPDDALIIDLNDAIPADVLTVAELPAGTYNQLDIEVFYLEMTVATIYPYTTSHDINYRMVYESMPPMEPRDFLLYLEPEWVDAESELGQYVSATGWYWLDRSNADHVEPVDPAGMHPDFAVLDLFANDEYWSREHQVLEGGRIDPPLVYDPAKGGTLTISFGVTGTFNFKDYHDETLEPDGLWEIRRDAGIHPFPPQISCIPD